MLTPPQNYRMIEPRLSDVTAQVERDRASLEAVRLVQCLAKAHVDGGRPHDLFALDNPRSPFVSRVQQQYAMRQKGVIGAATPGGSIWAAPLMPTEMGRALMAYAQQFSIVGRLGLTGTPFNVRVPAESSPLSGVGWIGHGGASAVVLKGTLTSTTLDPLDVAGIVLLTKELVRATSEAAVVYLRQLLGRALAEFLDVQFTNPAIAAVTSLSPASVTNGLTPVASNGGSAEAAVEDIRELVAAFIAGGGRLEQAVLLLSSQNAVALRLSGHLAFSELTVSGGRAGGLPALASDAVSTNVVLVDPTRILIADAGDVDFTIAQDASLQMLDNPTNNSGTATATTSVSLFQTNSVALRATRTVNWQALAGAVQYVADADYVSIGSPA